MAITNALVGGGGPVSVFQASTGTEAAITCILMCNVSDSLDVLIDVWCVPDGQVETDANKIMKSVLIPATETFVMDTERLILGSQDQIYVEADVPNVVAVTVSSVQV